MVRRKGISSNWSRQQRRGSHHELRVANVDQFPATDGALFEAALARTHLIGLIKDSWPFLVDRVFDKKHTPFTRPLTPDMAIVAVNLFLNAPHTEESLVTEVAHETKLSVQDSQQLLDKAFRILTLVISASLRKQHGKNWKREYYRKSRRTKSTKK